MIETTQEIDNHSVCTGRYSPDFKLPTGKDWLFRYHFTPNIGPNYLVDLYVSPDRAHITLTEYAVNIAEAGLACGWSDNPCSGVIPAIPYMVYHRLLSRQNAFPWLVNDYINTLEHICSPIDEGCANFYVLSECGSTERGVPLSELTDHEGWPEFVCVMESVRGELLELGVDGRN